MEIAISQRVKRGKQTLESGKPEVNRCFGLGVFSNRFYHILAIIRHLMAYALSLHRYDLNALKQGMATSDHKFLLNYDI